MAGKYSMIGANAMLVLVCLGVVQLCTAQTVHVVGGSTGWTFPSSTSFYSDWAASQTFRIGDVLEFNFTTGFHSVATVTKSAYDTCNVTNPLALSTTGPVNITVTSGTHYFFCTYPGHCNAGQKFTVVSASAASPSPVVAPTPSPRATAPSPSPRAHAPSPSPRTTAPSPSPRASAPAPTTASKSPKKAPAASPSSSPAVSPTPSSTPASTTTASSAPAEGPGGATPSTTTPPSSAPPAAAAGVLISLVSVAVALLY